MSKKNKHQKQQIKDVNVPFYKNPVFKIALIDILGLIVLAIGVAYINTSLKTSPHLFALNLGFMVSYLLLWYYLIDRKIDGVLWQGILLLIAGFLVEWFRAH